MKKAALIWSYFGPIVMKYKKVHIFFYALILLAMFSGQVLLPLGYKSIIDSIEGLTPTGTTTLTAGVTMIFVWWAISFLINDIANRGGAALYAHIHTILARDVRINTVERFLKHSPTFFSKTFSGSLTSKFDSYATAMYDLHAQTYYGVIAITVKVFIILIVVFSLSPWLGVVLTVWTIVFSIITVVRLKEQMRLDFDRSKERSKMIGGISDAFSNIQLIKSLGRDDYELEHAKKGINELFRKVRLTSFYSERTRAIQGLLASLLHFCAVLVAVMFWNQGLITVGTVAVISLYVVSIYDTVWQLGSDMRRVVHALSDAQETLDIFGEVPEILDPQNPTDTGITKGEIAFNSVAFTYVGGSQVFTDLNLTIKAGERVALVGHSGAGKSTIAKLLLRFNDPTSGSVSIDGINIRDVSQKYLRENISYVPQDPSLLHRSIKENIGYGRLGATDDEIIAAAKSAHAHEFIMKTEKGYDSLVGERGIKLSGGERQRVAIARAMLSKAPILLLDEATSALDSITERHIQEGLDILMKNRTTIIVAHRLSTIVKMDRILVFQEGTIIEDGPHQKLLELGGVYASLWKSQSEGFIKD